MTQGNANILDMLLGPVTPQALNGQPGQVGSDNSVGPQFNDLLSILMDRLTESGLPQSGVPANNGQGMSFGPLMSRVLTGGVPHSMGQVANSEHVISGAQKAWSGNGSQLPSIWPTAGEPAVTDSKAAVDDSILTNMSSRSFDGPALSSSASRFVHSLLRAGIESVHQPMSLTEGRYQIASARISDNTAQLTLRHADSSSQTVQITLPAEMLDDLAAPVRQNAQVDGKATTQRINIFDYSQNQSHRSDTGPIIDHLFAKLQLKELKVSRLTGDEINLPDKESVTGNKNFLIELTARRAGQEISAQRILPREQLHVRRPVANQAQPTEDDNPFNQVLPSRTMTVRSPAFTQVGQPHGEPMKAVNWFRPLELKDPMQQPDEDGELTQKILMGSGQSGRGENSMQTSRQGIQITRFVLPDNLTQTLKPNGQSVRIAIEPDNIGPARLHLVMRDSGLTARVTVDTTAAKALIDNSLDQLSQQLQQAGVKVDAIEVNVAGGQTDPHRFEQSLARHQLNRMTRLDDTELTSVESSHTDAPDRARMSEYAGPGGVNIYA